jgi:hypothetical protein
MVSGLETDAMAPYVKYEASPSLNKPIAVAHRRRDNKALSRYDMYVDSLVHKS